MSRREAEGLLRDYGGSVVEDATRATIVVVADDGGPAASDLASAVREAIARGETELLRESELWSRLGLVDRGAGVARLYTSAMLGELLHVPITAIRQWHRHGALRATCEVRRLAYFDFEEVRIGRKLASLFSAGCTLRTIHRKLDELARLLPDVDRPLADPGVVVEGRRLFVRRADALAEPSGQLLLDFGSGPRTSDMPGADDTELVSLPFAPAALGPGTGGLEGGEVLASATVRTSDVDVEELRRLAIELEEEGSHDPAIEVYREILFSGRGDADDQFALAELLYLKGDRGGARERYSMAIEMDEDFVEARSNLGCVLAEEGELKLAEAAFRGTLEYHPDYADAHYHLARLLDRMEQPEQAAIHWQRFAALAPASPWAAEAGDRLADGGTESLLQATGRGSSSDEAPRST